MSTTGAYMGKDTALPVVAFLSSWASGIGDQPHYWLDLQMGTATATSFTQCARLGFCSQDQSPGVSYTRQLLQ